MKISRGLPDRPNSGNSLKTMLLGNSKLVFLSPMAARLLFLTMVEGPLFFKFTAELGWRDGKRVSYNVLTKIQYFS